MPYIFISGSVICLGSVLFLIAAFSPSSRVFGVPTIEDKLAIVNRSPGGWRLSQALFALGALITALGTGILAYSLSWLGTSLPYLPAMLMFIGALAWSVHAYLRAVDPQAFVAGTLPAWHFRLYTLLTLAAYFLLGFGLLRLLGTRPWQGYLLMGASMVLFILYLQFKDMPPFVYYVLGLILGITLLRGGL